jgi:hypothetical protein
MAYLFLILALSWVFVSGCTSGPQMPVSPLLDEEPSCHEEMPQEKEEASYQGCIPTCSKDGSVCYSNCAGGVM